VQYPKSSSETSVNIYQIKWCNIPEAPLKRRSEKQTTRCNIPEAPLKRRSVYTRLHCSVSQKTAVWTLVAVRTSNLIKLHAVQNLLKQLLCVIYELVLSVHESQEFCFMWVVPLWLWTAVTRLTYSTLPVPPFLAVQWSPTVWADVYNTPSSSDAEASRAPSNKAENLWNRSNAWI
jgi:hypothetical protein